MYKTTNYCKIYGIGNTYNEKLYIGQTWQPILQRFWQHKSDKKGQAPKLFNAMNAHGREKFFIVELVVTKCQECANWLEDYLIELNKTRGHDTGYNVRGGGSRGKMSEESKRKISLANMGRICSESTKRAVSLAQTGKTLSSEHMAKLLEANTGARHFMFGRHLPIATKIKISNAKKGSIPWNKGLKLGPLSEECKRKLSEALSGEKHPLWGKHHSEAAKQKMSENSFMKGRTGSKNRFFGEKHTDETKQKMRACWEERKSNGWVSQNTGENNPMFGKHHTDETKQKLSEALSGDKNPWFGKHHTEESKQKNREAHSGENSVWFGKNHSDETKLKMKNAAIKRETAKKQKKQLATQVQNFYTCTIYANLELTESEIKNLDIKEFKYSL